MLGFVNGRVVLLTIVRVDSVLLKLAREALLLHYSVEALLALLNGVEENEQAQVINCLDL